jgi:hypothetical protein
MTARKEVITMAEVTDKRWFAIVQRSRPQSLVVSSSSSDRTVEEGIVDVIETLEDGVQAGASLRDAVIAALGSRPAGSVTVTWLIGALACRCTKASDADCVRAAHRLKTVMDVCMQVGCRASDCLAVLEGIEKRQERYAALQDRACAIPEATVRLFLILLPVMLIGEIASGAQPFKFFCTLPGVICALCGGLCVAVGSVWVKFLLRSVQSDVSSGQSGGITSLLHELTTMNPGEGGEANSFAYQRLASVSALYDDDNSRLDPSSPLDFLLIVSLIRVCLQSGEPLPGALKAIGQCGSIPALRRIAHMLEEGEEWSDAWKAALSYSPCTHLQILESALHDSWCMGVSADMKLQRVIGRQEEDLRTRLESISSRLSIRLLVPVGLCFLPAFILIAVVPSIVSYAGMG